MGESRNVYVELEDRVLLRTADVYQTEVGDDVESYSDTLLSVVANFKNAGRPEGFNAQSMAGKSKRGEVACRLFAVVDPDTRVVVKAGFKARGCLAITACASVACTMLEGRVLEDALAITVDDLREALDGVPAGKTNTLYFAVEAIRALVGDYLVREGADLATLNEVVGCDESSVACMMCEHCSLRSIRTDMLVNALEQGEARAEETRATEVPEAADDAVAATDDAAAGGAGAVGVAGAGAVALADTEVAVGAGAEDAACEAPVPSDDAATTDPADGRPAFPEDVAPTEHNAIALALEAVRGASRMSRLATPDLWDELGLVPPAMTAEDLEMRVYDYLTAWQAAHPEAQAAASAGAGDAQTPAEAGRNRAARRSPFGPKRAVGAPTLFARRTAEAASGDAAAQQPPAGEGVGAADQVTQQALRSQADDLADPAAGATATDAPALPVIPVAHDDAQPQVIATVSVQHDEDPAGTPEASAPAPVDDARAAAALAALDDFVEEADDGPLDDDDPFPTLHVPEGKRLVRRDGAYVLVDAEEMAVDEGGDPLEDASVTAGLADDAGFGEAADPATAPGGDSAGVADAPAPDDELPIRCEDIALLMGAHGYYLYDRSVMTDAYAHWAFLAAEDDPVVTFLDCVREDSRVYPRPFARANLANDPFNLDADVVEAAFEAARADEANADIERLVASNGDVYFFSTRYLDPDYAQSLAEWASVERFRNV